ncbi:triosephosphate isomerase [Perkinsela sp. CCAP 1560/4]|nr:triosephosphate isomerase [Perkinsela sp. CCAP 1560/4]|eukprot:KNH09570.1 triosephosphate isomerase [Perkinsela sp. CCAP 1560/4]
MIPQYQPYHGSFGNDPYSSSYNQTWSSYSVEQKSPLQSNSTSRQHTENLGIESPDMIPRNLLDGLTPALSPQMQPSSEIPPMSLSLPPTSGSRIYLQSSYDCISGVSQNPYNLCNSIKGDGSKSYLQPVHMRPGFIDSGDVNGEASVLRQNRSMSSDKMQLRKMREDTQQSVDNTQDDLLANKSSMNPLLDDFHNRISSRWSLLDLRGNVYEFSKDQDGSRFIQRQMEAAPDDVRFMIVQELVHHANTLTKDVFGNYVIQKALEYGTVDQRISIVERLLGNIPELTLHTYACRVVQKALEHIKHSLRLEIAKELHDVTLTCIYDQNGNHVLQKCIEVLPDNVDFIVNALKGNIWGVACHAYGCRVMQRLLEQSPIALRNADDLLQEIFSYSRALTRNQYGNYVVQHLLISSGSKYRDAIVDIVLPEFFELACHKFASNVIEKVIVFSESENHEKLMKKCFTEKDSDDVHCLVKLVTNPFGNYVVQRLFEFGNKEEKAQIASLLAAHMPLIERNSCSRHIIPFILANAKDAHEKTESKSSKSPRDQAEKKVSTRNKNAADYKSFSDSMDQLTLKSVSSAAGSLKGNKSAPPGAARASHLPPTPTMPYAAAVQKSFKTPSQMFNQKASSQDRKVYPKAGHSAESGHRTGSKTRAAYE